MSTESAPRTPVWRRSELEKHAAQFGITVDEFLSELDRVRTLVGAPAVVHVVGEPGPDQLIQIDPGFARAAGIV